MQPRPLLPQNDVRSDAKCVIYRPSASYELRELLWLLPTRPVGDDVSRVGRFPLPALQSGDQRAVGPVDLVHGRKHVPVDQTETLGLERREVRMES